MLACFLSLHTIKKFRCILLPQASVIKVCNKFTNISCYDWLFRPFFNWHVQNMLKDMKNHIGQSNQMLKWDVSGEKTVPENAMPCIILHM